MDCAHWLQNTCFGCSSMRWTTVLRRLFKKINSFKSAVITIRHTACVCACLTICWKHHYNEKHNVSRLSLRHRCVWAETCVWFPWLWYFRGVFSSSQCLPVSEMRCFRVSQPISSNCLMLSRPNFLRSHCPALGAEIPAGIITGLLGVT